MVNEKPGSMDMQPFEVERFG